MRLYTVIIIAESQSCYFCAILIIEIIVVEFFQYRASVLLADFKEVTHAPNVLLGRFPCRNEPAKALFLTNVCLSITQL